VWTFSISPKYCLSHMRFCDPVLILRVVMSLDELFLLGLKWICFSKIVSQREKDLQMYQSKFIWSITLKKIHIFMNIRENMQMMSPQITCLLKKLFLTLITIIFLVLLSKHEDRFLSRHLGYIGHFVWIVNVWTQELLSIRINN
jgi:hypothetical protein